MIADFFSLSPCLSFEENKLERWMESGVGSCIQHALIYSPRKREREREREKKNNTLAFTQQYFDVVVINDHEDDNDVYRAANNDHEDDVDRANHGCQQVPS